MQPNSLRAVPFGAGRACRSTKPSASSSGGPTPERPRSSGAPDRLGGRQGGEFSIQREQDEPRARGTSASGGSDRKGNDPGEYF